MTINIGDFETIITNHMEEQPYGEVCSECGGGLYFTKRVDQDFDLKISVEPCDCQKED